MPTVIISYADKTVMGVGIRCECEPLHLSILSDDGRLAPTLQRRLLNLTQYLKIHIRFASIFAASSHLSSIVISVSEIVRV
jgi:hypothetical protein